MATLHGEQNFKIYVRKTAGTPTPTLTAELREANTLRATLLTDQSITSTTGQLLTLPWQANLLTDLTGADVELRLVSTPGQGPGALPAYSSAGTLLTSATMPGANQSVNVPAHSSGDLLVLLVLCRNNNNNGTLDSINTADWTQAGGAGNMYGGTQNARIGFGWKIGNGSESTVSITTSGGTTTDRLNARVYRFTAANGFHATAVQDIGTATAGSGTTLTMPTVTPGGTNRLAIALLGVATSTTMAAATGESGGDWTEPVAEDAQTNGTTAIQISDQSGGGAISGGTVTITTEDWVGIGFTLVPAQVNVNTVEYGAIEWNARTLVSGVLAPSLADAISLTELITPRLPLWPVLTEPVTVAELVTPGVLLQPVLADAVTLTEVMTPHVLLQPKPTETITLAEVTTLSNPVLPAVSLEAVTVLEVSDVAGLGPLTPQPSVTESVTVAEAITPRIAIPPSGTEAVTLAEVHAISLALPPAGLEALTLTDTLALAIPLLTSRTEAVSVAEVVLASLLIQPQRTEAVTLTETGIASPALAPLSTDAVISQDVLTINLLLQPAFTEAVLLTELVSVSAALLPQQTEAVTLAEVITAALPLLPATGVDAISLAEVVTLRLPLLTAVTEAITVDEALTLQFSLLFPAGTDAILVGESPFVIIPTVGVLAMLGMDAVTLAETAALTLVLPATGIDAVMLAEQLTLGLGLPLMALDAVVLGETFRFELPLPSRSTENVTLTEVSALGLALPLTGTDAATVGDLLTVDLLLQPTAADAMALTELIDTPVLSLWMLGSEHVALGEVFGVFGLTAPPVIAGIIQPGSESVGRTGVGGEALSHAGVALESVDGTGVDEEFLYRS